MKGKGGGLSRTPYSPLDSPLINKQDFDYQVTTKFYNFASPKGGYSSYFFVAIHFKQIDRTSEIVSQVYCNNIPVLLM